MAGGRRAGAALLGLTGLVDPRVPAVVTDFAETPTWARILFAVELVVGFALGGATVAYYAS